MKSLWHRQKSVCQGESLNKCSGVLLHFEGLHLVHAAHAVGFHRGDGLAEQDEVEAGEGLDGWMVGDVAVYLLAGLGAERVVVAGHEVVFIHKGDVPEGHVADDVMLHHFRLVLLVMNDGGKWQGAILTDGYHCPREIYVSEIVLHSYDVISGSFLHYLRQFPYT